MSGKKFKQLRNDEKEKQADYLNRRDAFLNEIKQSSSKYRIDLVGGLEYRQSALVPILVFVDVKEKYEHLTEEAKKTDKGNGKTKLII